MNTLAVVVPVKSDGGKSRLSPVLTANERKAFARSMFLGLLGALTKAGLIGSCMVVSSDRDALKFAAALGARPVRERADSGVNSAVHAAMAAAPKAGEFLVLPSDLPLLRAPDVLGLLRLRALGPEIVLSPSSSFDGTNALLFPRDPSFPLSFDRDSFWNHLDGASGLGFSVGVCARRGIMFDVDSPADLMRLAGSKARSESAGLARELAR